MLSPTTPPPPPKLRFTEWTLTGAFLLVLISLVLIAKIQAHRLSVNTVLAPPPVEIVLEGEVERPGTYLTPLGTPLHDVVRKAGPKRFADVSFILPETRVTAPLHLKLQPLTHLTITVEGAVTAPGSLTVPIGTRISDLKKYLTLTPDADRTFFKKRRLLKNNEKITIPQGK